MRILIISDVHANLVALEAVLAAAAPCDAIWNLGDTVGYGPKPAECLARLDGDQVQVSLLGNHDLAAVGMLDLATFNPWARAAAIWTRGQLSAAERDRLRALPAAVVASGVTLAHASPRDPIWEYIVDAKTARANFRAFDTACCFIGHTHVPRIAYQDSAPGAVTMLPFNHGDEIDLARGRWLINPGSVGQPRDGDPRAACAVLDTALGTVTSVRVGYEVATTQRQMTEARLPAPLIARLAVGL